MLVFSIIAILIVGFLWFNTSIVDYHRVSDGYWSKYKPDVSTARRLPITIGTIILLSLLLIPCVNLILFILYIGWWIKRAAYPEYDEECTVYLLEVKKYSPFLWEIYSCIKNFITKKLV